MRLIKNNYGVLLSVFLVISTIAIFGPIEFYCTNNNEFWFSFKILLWIVFMLALCCGSILILITMLLKGKARDIWGVFIFAIGVAAYIQGNYANINNGVLDGTEVEWNANALYAFLDTVGWLFLIIIFLMFFFKKRNIFVAMQKYICLYIIAIQIVSLGYLVITNNVFAEKSEYYLSSEDMYTVSNNRNIIIFVLDAFDDAYFQEIYNENPEKYKTIFEDFTYYDNAVAGAARTKAALPAIITGEAYPGKISYTEYIKKAFDNDGLYSELKKQNYDVGIYTEPIFIPDDSKNLVNNQESSGYEVESYTGLIKKYFDLVLYKYMPYIAKPYFWVYSGDFDQFKNGTTAESYSFEDNIFLENMKFSVVEDKNIFRLYHLNGAHGPYWLNELAQLQEYPTDVNQQAKGALYIVEEYLSGLKKLDIYDDSTIIIMADHGDENEKYGIDNEAHAILFVKLQNTKNKFTVSSAPVSYFDLHATLFSELGIKKGAGFGDILEGETRGRNYYQYFSDGRGFKVYEYIIQDNINNANALKKTGNVLEPTTEFKKYKYGNRLTFGANSSALPFIVSGVSGTDPGNYAWTMGKECVFKFILNKRPKDNLLVTMDIVSVITENGPQELLVLANGSLCYQTQVMENTTEIQFIVPGNMVEEKELLLQLILPDAISPKEFSGETGDPRVLSLALSGLCIDQTAQMPEEYMELSNKKTIDCTRSNKGLQSLLKEGVSYPEEYFTWTDGIYASFIGILEKKPENDINCTIKLVAIQNSHQRIEITSMGRTLLLKEIDSGTEEISFVIPKACVAEGILSLRLGLPDAISESELGTGTDMRRLGIAIKEISFQ